MSFEEFKKWALDNGYEKNLTIDRIDNDGNYEPDNCRWTNLETQSNNKRTNVKIEYNGEARTVNQWAREYGINYGTLQCRLKRGMSMKEALETPVNGGKGSGYKPHIDKEKTRETIKNMLNGINDNAELESIHKFVFEAYHREIKKKYKL